MALALKFLLCLKGKFFDFKKKLFRYYRYSVKLQQMFSCEVVGKGLCIARMSIDRNYSYNIIQS